MLTRVQIKGAMAMLDIRLADLGKAMRNQTSANALSAFLKGGDMHSERRASLEDVLRDRGAVFGDENWVGAPDQPEPARDKIQANVK